MTKLTSIGFLFVACIGGAAYGQSKGDECSNAMTANLGANSFDTSFATSSSPEPDDSQCASTSLVWGNSQDLWFSFTPATGGDYNFTTCDVNSYDTSMVLYAGSCDNQVACNGDTLEQPGCQGYHSAIDYTLAVNTEYFIRVGGWDGASGSGTLTIENSGGSGGQGACCIDGTKCFISDREYCLAQGGEWTKGADCSSIKCGGGSSWGACCVEITGGGYQCYDGEVGTDHNESICLEYGGEWTDDADCLSIECPPIGTPAVWYVDQNSTNTPDGTSWETAFLDVQDALDVASSGNQIWIAQGWYVPTDTNGADDSREASFRLIAGVEIYGGFFGNETSLDHQEPDVYKVFFSGDLLSNDGEGGDTSDNAYHVVTADALVGSSPVLDGVYIRSGNANSAGNNKFGGGLIVSNYASSSSAYPLVQQCRFVSNEATYGGGVATSSAADGVTLTLCKIAKNNASLLGGAIFNNGSCALDNTLIVGNFCEEGAGAIYSAGGNLKLINTTIAQNKAAVVGGVYIQSEDSSNNVASNNIIWGNRDVNGENIQLHIEGGSWDGNYNCIEDIGSSLGGVGNIDLNPRFVNEFGGDGEPGTGDEDFHILQQSPCIDAGDNVPNFAFLDFYDNLRVVDDPYTVDTGNAGKSGPPIIDIGADEHFPEPGGGGGELVTLWGGGFSNNFDDYQNWLPGEVPGAGDTALFSTTGSRLIQFITTNRIGSLFVTGGDLTFDLSGISLELGIADGQTQIDPLRAVSYDSPSTVVFKGGGEWGELRIQNDPVHLVGSNISFKDGVELVAQQGVLLSEGTIFNFDGDMYGNLTNTGSVIQPGGTGVGHMVIYGDLIHQTNQNPDDADNRIGSMVFDLNGYDATGNVRSDHIEVKQYEVGGHADLNCVIELHWGDVTPTAGDTYDILSADVSIVGEPTVVYCSGLPLDLGFNWFTSSGPAIRGGDEGGVETTGPILFESSGTTDLDNLTEPYDMVVADFDGVRGPDVAMSVSNGSGDGSVVILLNDGMSGDTWLGFTESVSSPITVGVDPRDLEVGDFNGDGTANDLVVANYGDDDISVLTNDNSGIFTKIDYSTGASGAGPRFISVGDYFEGTPSRDDIVVACDSFFAIVFQNTTPLVRGATFVLLPAAHAIPQPGDIDPGDTNNDKDLDYICLDVASEEVRVLEGTGDGGVVTGPIGSVTGTSLPNGSTPTELEFADLNVDGNPDVITVNEGDDSLSILLGDGSEFGSASSFTVGTSPQSMTVHDFDNDGDDDLVVSIINVERELVIIRNDSAGTVVLSAGDAVGSGSEPVLVEHGDFDQDGLEDLACVIDLGGAPLRGPVNPGIGIYFNTTEVVVNCPADINGDDVVDVSDVLAIISAWGEPGGAADVNGDSIVDVSDLLVIISAWGAC